MLCIHCGEAHSSWSKRCKGDKSRNIYVGPTNAPHDHDWHMLEQIKLLNSSSEGPYGSTMLKVKKFICLICDEVKEIK